MAALSGTFSFVLIPAEEGSPMELKEGDKSGGLENDYLISTAKQYFHEQSGGDAQAARIDNLTPDERKALAAQIRQQYITNNPKASPQFAQMGDDQLVELVKSTQVSASCDIVALTVPTKVNSYFAVSMYCADEAKRRGLGYNSRATELLKACGHVPAANDGDEAGTDQPPGVYGDVFVGRCFDKEETDVWQRVDFTVNDASPTAEWTLIARQKGGGGGGGTASAHSLSGTMTNALQQNPAGAAGGGQPGQIQEDLGYAWSQTGEEVELKFAVASGTKAKYVKVNFGRDSLKVTVAGQTLVNGKTGGLVNKDECTYTIQDDDEGKGRELCVTLGKHNSSEWPFPVQGK
mmetsp:Transcript_11726/g.16576  ORF Transcript_11726/g.16576 Transcript_11726/m.16576 type:complete len:348 (+) Transcript_11726:170-1213(+)